MRTSEFIGALAADPIPTPIRLGRRIAAALVIGVVGSLALYLLLLGPRPDIAEAARTVRFCLKFVDSLAFALPSLLLMLRLARPDAKPRALALWLIAPLILLAAGVVVQDRWSCLQTELLSRLVGEHAMRCTITIPMLAAPILAALIVAPAASRCPAASGLDRRARRRGLGRNRGADLRFQLPERLAFVRGDPE